MKSISNNPLSRLLALFLSLLMIVSVLAACQNTPKPGGTTGPEEVTAGETESNELIAKTPKQDFKGRDFTFLTVGTSERYCKEIFVEIEDTEEVIYESVYRRNEALASHLNVVIKNLPANDPYGTAQILVETQDYTADVYDLPQHGCVPFLTGGYARDWNELSLQYSEPWWNPEAMTNLTVNGKVFMMSGSILITEIEAAVAMVYNKQLYQDYQMTYDMYGSVLEGSWTLDAFLGLVSMVSEDLNKDGVIEMGEDRFGYAADPNSMAMNWPFACGLVKSSIRDGIYEPVVDIARATDMLEKLSKMFASDNADETMPLVDGVVCFNDGKVFLYGLTLYNLESLRWMEDDYGIVPYPKYDEKQAKYITHVGGAAPIMFIPIHNTAEDAYLTTVLDAMGEASYKITRPGYYEVALKEKGTRDETSKKVLDMILNARVYDLAYICSSGVAWMVGSMVAAGETGFARKWDKQSQRQIKLVQDYVDQILENAG